jgi:hypothetical protein
VAAQGAGKRDSEPTRLFLAASYLVLLVGGAVVAILGAFLLPYSVSAGTAAATPAGSGAAHVIAAGSPGGPGQLLSVGLLVALVANPALSLAGLWTAGTRLAAFTPLAGWLIVVIVLLPKTASGSLILPNDLRSLAFLLIGALAFTAVATLGRPTRGMKALAGQPLPRGGPPAPAGRAKPPAPAGRAKPAAPAGRAKPPETAHHSETARNTGSRRTAPKRGRRR